MVTLVALVRVLVGTGKLLTDAMMAFSYVACERPFFFRGTRNDLNLFVDQVMHYGCKKRCPLKREMLVPVATF